MRTFTNDIFSFAMAFVVLMPWAIVAALSSAGDSLLLEANANGPVRSSGNASASVKVHTMINGNTVVDIDEEYVTSDDEATVWIEVNEEISTDGSDVQVKSHTQADRSGSNAEASVAGTAGTSSANGAVQIEQKYNGLLAALETIRLMLLSYAGKLF